MKNNFQSIYDKTIKLFSKKASWKAISIISFFESIIFPVPTDLFLIPAIIANKNKVIFLIFVTVFFSVVGGIVGYMIGFFFWDIVSEYFYIFYPNFEARFNTFKSTFNSYGWLFVLAGGFTPFPFKIAAVSSGILELNIIIFILFSFISRGLRFSLVGFLLFKYGSNIDRYLRKYINYIVLFTTVIFLLYLIFR